MDLDLNKIFNKKLLYLTGFFLLLEILSFFAFSINFLAWPIFIALVLSAGILTWLKLENGAYILIVDLILSGLGYWFFIDIGNFRIPIRLALFTTILLIWLIKTIQVNYQDFLTNKNKLKIIEKAFFLNDPKIIQLIFFGIIVILAITIGLLSHRGLGQVFLDVNNYFYLGAIFLFLSVKLRIDKFIMFLLAGTYALVIKTIFTLLFFGYIPEGSATLIYRWIRDTRIGEITAVFPPLYRIFFQSHIYNLVVLLILLCLIFLIKNSKKHNLFLILSAWLNFWIILISGSRSLWVAMFITCGLFLIILFKKEVDYYRKKQSLLDLIYSFIKPINLSIFLFLCLISGQYFTNIILNDYKINLIFSRVSDEYTTNLGGSSSAVSSRGAQFYPLVMEIKKSPIWGRGFGKTITYFNSDPRINNNYTTSSFELAYLDMWLKFGLLGLFFYFLFITQTIKESLINSNRNNYYYFSVLIIFSLIIINIFTPYLNHPLGIGLILMIVGLNKSFSDNFRIAS